MPDRERCLTPPLAEDIRWTQLDDDPLGIYTELGGRSSPATPPPLRALRLTSLHTVNTIRDMHQKIRCLDSVFCLELFISVADPVGSESGRIRTFLQDPDPKVFHWIRILP